MDIENDGTNWQPLPEDAHWNRAEGAFLVDGVPVFTMVYNREWYYIFDEG